MTEGAITIGVPELEHVLVTVSGAYSYHDSRPLRWLQRLCLWILRTLGCQHLSVRDTVKVTQFSMDSLLEAIWEQMMAIDFIYARKARYILIGKDHLARLGAEIQDCVAIDIPWAPGLKELYGARLITVPWFNGVVCLPDLEKL